MTSNLTHSMESVVHQKDTKLFNALVEAFQKIRDSNHKFRGLGKDDREVIEESGVESVLFEHSGINVQLRIDPSIGYINYVIPPDLDKNHPLHSTITRSFSGRSIDAIKHIEKAKDSIEGYVDLEQGRIGGVFSEIVSRITMSSKMIMGDLFTTEEVTAIFLHEVGHLFVYYEYLGRHIVLNHVLGDVTRGFNESDNVRYRTKIVDVAAEQLDMRSLDANTIAQAKDGETAQTMIVSLYANEWVSATNTYLYDERTWERLADQFVTRNGGARHLATAMDRKYRMAGVGAHETNVGFMKRQTMSVLVLTLFAPVTLLVLALSSPRDEYDPPQERLKSMRKDVVDAMKDNKLDSEYRKRLQADADAIKELMDQGEDREDLLHFVWRKLVPGVRKQTNRLRLMQDLEDLANNELYVKANELKLIAETN